MPEVSAPTILLPEENYVRDLPMRVESVGEGAVGRLELDPGLLTESRTLGLGSLFTLLDATAGRPALRAADPDFVVTTDMALHSLRPIRRGPATGEAEIDVCPYVTNHVNALHGGVLSTLAEIAPEPG